MKEKRYQKIGKLVGVLCGEILEIRPDIIFTFRIEGSKSHLLSGKSVVTVRTVRRGKECASSVCLNDSEVDAFEGDYSIVKAIRNYLLNCLDDEILRVE